MNILMKIDQAEALRRGYDAPSSTERVGIDPAQLSQAERDVLAAVLVDGHDATRQGIRVLPYGEPHWLTPPMIARRPGVEGLREAIGSMLETQSELRDRYRRERAAFDAELAELLDQEMEMEMVNVGIDRDGQRKSGGGSVLRTEVAVPQIPNTPARVVTIGSSRQVLLRPDERWERYVQRLCELRERRMEAAREALRHELPALLEREREEREAREAAYAALYARLPDTLRRRADDGFCGPNEIQLALQRLIRADHYPNHPDYPEWDRSEPIAVLSDEEYQKLAAIRDRAPEGATCEPLIVCWDDDDDDDEPSVVRIVLVEWSHPSGVPGRAVFELQQQPRGASNTATDELS